MLNLDPPRDRFINSPKYVEKSIQFSQCPEKYTRDNGLDELMQNVLGINKNRITDKLRSWVFILNYIFEEAEENEVTHYGLVELKHRVSRSNTLWNGNYVWFAYYFTLSYDMSSSILPKDQRIELFESTPLDSSRFSLNPPQSLNFILVQCEDIFLKVHEEFPVRFTYSGYTPSMEGTSSNPRIT